MSFLLITIDLNPTSKPSEKTLDAVQKGRARPKSAISRGIKRGYLYAQDRRGFSGAFGSGNWAKIFCSYNRKEGIFHATGSDIVVSTSARK
jgi:hypothetical protein